MRTLCKPTMLLAAAALLVGPLLAQLPAAAGNTFVAVSLVMNPAVQTELKLSDDQVDKVKTLTKDMAAKQQAEIAKLKDVDPKDRNQKVRDMMKQLAEDTLKSLSGILTAEQGKRLKQLEAQQLGLQYPDAQKALNLTDEQKEKIKTIHVGSIRETAQVLRTEKGKEAQEKLQKIRKDAREKTEAVLTAEQQKTWKDLTGAPFDLEQGPNIRPLPAPIKPDDIKKNLPDEIKKIQPGDRPKRQDPNKPDIYRTQPKKIEI